MQLSTPKMQLSPMTLMRFLGALIVIGAIYVVGSRVHIAANAPLWLDETWSGMITTRADWPEFWREAWLDCNPPLYYLFLTGWVGLFGDSNLMLRLPSILFVIAAAMLPVIWRPQGLNRVGAWTVAALILLWPQGLGVMLDARGFGLMLLLSTMSCLVVNQMLERLTLKRAAAWVALGTMMFLTHYFAAVLVIGQVIVLFYRHRAGMFRIWPTAIIAVPGLAWFAYHMPRLREYARPDVVWQQHTNAESALGNLTYIFGVFNVISLGVIAGILLLLYDRKRKSSNVISSTGSDHNLLLVAGTAAIGFTIAIIVGTLQASLVDRYLVPLVPPTMFGLALITQRTTRQEIAGLLLAFIFLMPGLNAKQAEQAVNGRAMYGYENGSAFIRERNPDQLIFMWDHPGAKIIDPQSLASVGSYFMARDGLDLPVKTVVAPENSDANVLLRAAANSPRAAVIWLFNKGDTTAARNRAPTFENDPAWTCHDRGKETPMTRQLGAIACIKSEKADD
jgi:hypothetical protein